ncbi:MAG: ATP-binding protein [Candidatus Omnitrophica bacterium]|nr:ATP-binding protein [Candidatus Omnitrophota bacterium]
MAAIFHADIPQFSVIRSTMFTVSYIFLFEFARSSLFGPKGRWKAIIIYGAVLAAVSYNQKYDEAWLNAGIRYFIGLPAGLFASGAVIFASRSEKSGRGSLLFLGIMMALYAVTSGLVVPKTNLWMADFLNIESFYNFIGIPVQVIRGLLILFSATAVWVYSQASPSHGPQQIGHKIHFKPSKWVTALTMLTLISLGWAFTNYMDYYAGVQIIRNSKVDQNSPLNRLNRELSRLETAVSSISTTSRIIYALTLPAPRYIERTNRLLEEQRKAYSALDCFIMDRYGTILASAAGGSEKAAVGEEYRAMPYFKEAMAGRIGYYFTRGSVYDERIYYVSAPIRQSRDDIAGAVVIKKSIIVKPILQYRLISIIITFFVCMLAIVFFFVLKRRERFIAFAEEANKKLQALDTMKNDFIAIVSHDLRTPLTAIKNSVTLLSKGWPDKRVVDPKQKELLDIIMSNTNRQIRMISDLLDISKIEAGVMSVHAESMDITVLSTDMINSLKSQADEKKITLKMAPDCKPIEAHADPEHTRRVLSNLLNNAIKFTPEGGSIELKLNSRPDDVIVIISDTGVGIPADDINKLFNKFYRSSSVSHHKEGSGLGLAISKGLIEAQGGRIWVESKVGAGSSFYFTLPLARGIIRREGEFDDYNKRV